MNKTTTDLSIEFPENQWDFVHRFGHISFAMLGKCFKLENEFSKLAETSEISYKDSSSLPELQSISKDFFDHFYLAIISYQTTMEAIIEMCIDEDGEQDKEKNLQSKKVRNEKKDKEDDRKFKDKWHNSFVLQGIGCTEIDNYIAKIYKKYRLPLAHPTKDNLKTDPFQNIDLHEVLDSFKNGWQAFAAISAAIGKPHDADSWEKICEKHNLPYKKQST